MLLDAVIKKFVTYEFLIALTASEGCFLVISFVPNASITGVR
jgi:hypothetical protein